MLLHVLYQEMKSWDNTSLVLLPLHLLPISKRIHCKIICFMYQCCCCSLLYINCTTISAGTCFPITLVMRKEKKEKENWNTICVSSDVSHQIRCPEHMKHMPSGQESIQQQINRGQKKDVLMSEILIIPLELQAKPKLDLSCGHSFPENVTSFTLFYSFFS